MTARRKPRPTSRIERLAARTVPVAVASMGRRARPESSVKPMQPATLRAGQRAALAMVATGLAWALVTWAGGALEWPQRTRVFFDLLALAGFGLALWMTWQAWRLRRTDKG